VNGLVASASQDLYLAKLVAFFKFFRVKTIPLIFAITLMAATASRGAILAQYNFTAGSVASSDTDSTSTAGNFTISNGGTAGGGGGFSTTSNTAFFRSDGLTTSAAGALGAPDYFAFTFTPTGGSSFNLNSITLKIGGSNGGTTGGPAGGPFVAYTSSGFLRTNAETTPYSTDAGTFSQLIPGPGDGGTFNFVDAALPLSGPGFTNVTGPVTFRFYLYASDNTYSTQIPRIDDVVLNGDLVPEPSAALLGCIGSLSLLRRRR
jgi:hypothetical protein